ncbi:hypothetical protein [Medusavirus stheno T3]|uniref:Uncharacterized protein n=1 Tax=Medusavirus stheno T3 TaxID=3069717 RepID=A0A7S7YEF4_9VIRU|nr:hypothetical protein QKU73_gp087 [Acanthamoeba castellanii medusavirus]QPB44268.1 hypothetical protein [Medusavirus stheno T3]
MEPFPNETTLNILRWCSPSAAWKLAQQSTTLYALFREATPHIIARMADVIDPEMLEFMFEERSWRFMMACMKRWKSDPDGRPADTPFIYRMSCRYLMAVRHSWNRADLFQEEHPAESSIVLRLRAGDDLYDKISRHEMIRRCAADPLGPQPLVAVTWVERPGCGKTERLSVSGMSPLLLPEWLPVYADCAIHCYASFRASADVSVGLVVHPTNKDAWRIRRSVVDHFGERSYWATADGNVLSALSGSINWVIHPL